MECTSYINRPCYRPFSNIKQILTKIENFSNKFLLNLGEVKTKTKIEIDLLDSKTPKDHHPEILTKLNKF